MADGSEVKVNSISELEFPKNDKKYLGEGASGCVKLVRHKRLDKFFALKQMSIEKSASTRGGQEKKMELIKREIKLHKQLIHPNIIRLYDYFKVKGNIFLLMEWAQKGNLYNLMKTHQRLPEGLAVKYFAEACHGVEFLHQRKVIHRDLKPENLLISQDDVIKICDFGWSVNQDEDMRTTFCGTYEYMAPEIVENSGYDKRVDIWSLGILLYEMLHGYSPFKGNKMMSILENIRKGCYRIENHISVEAKQLITCILQVDPNQRPTADDILRHPLLRKYGLAKNTGYEIRVDRSAEIVRHTQTSERGSFQEQGLYKNTANLVKQEPKLVCQRQYSNNASPSPANYQQTARYQQGQVLYKDEYQSQGMPLSQRSYHEQASNHLSRKQGMPPSNHQRNKSSNIIPCSILNQADSFVKRNNSNSSSFKGGNQVDSNMVERSSSRGAIFENMANYCQATLQNQPVVQKPTVQNPLMAPLRLASNGVQEYGSRETNGMDSTRRAYDTQLSYNSQLVMQSGPLRRPSGDNPQLSHRDQGNSSFHHHTQSLNNRVDMNTSQNSNGGREHGDGSFRRQNPLLQSYGMKSNNTSGILANGDQQRPSETRREPQENVLGDITSRLINNQINKMRLNTEEDLEYSLVDRSRMRSVRGHNRNESESSVDPQSKGSFYFKETYTKNVDSREFSQDHYRVENGQGKSPTILQGAGVTRSRLHGQIQMQLIQANTSYRHELTIQQPVHHKVRGSDNEEGMPPRVYDRGSAVRTMNKQTPEEVHYSGFRLS